MGSQAVLLLQSRGRNESMIHSASALALEVFACMHLSKSSMSNTSVVPSECTTPLRSWELMSLMQE